MTKEKTLNKMKGITLISLVITIIILLILAGVTINLTLGENGIFRLAKYAGENYINAQDKELAHIKEFNNSILNTVEKLGQTEDKKTKETVNVVLKSNLNNVDDYSGVIITLENKTDSNKNQQYTIKDKENGHQFLVNENEEYSVKVSNKEDEFYVLNIPTETESYTAQAGNERTVEMIYQETGVYLYKDKKANTKLTGGGFEFKKTNESEEYTCTGSYTNDDAKGMTVSIEGFGSVMMLSKEKVNLQGYSKVKISTRITKNEMELYVAGYLSDTKDYEYRVPTTFDKRISPYATGLVEISTEIGERKSGYVGAGIDSGWGGEKVLEILEIKLEV